MGVTEWVTMRTGSPVRITRMEDVRSRSLWQSTHQQIDAASPSPARNPSRPAPPSAAPLLHPRRVVTNDADPFPRGRGHSTPSLLSSPPRKPRARLVQAQDVELFAQRP